MRRTFALSIVLLLSATALTGCTLFGGDDEPPATTTPDTPTPTTPVVTTPTTTPTVTPPTNGTPPLDSSTYTLTAVGAPGQVKIGGRANFTLFVNGSVNSTTEHIGAHFANNDSTNPPGPGRSDCIHTPGTLPTSLVVSCPITAAGTWYVWGHARVNDSGTERNWWTATPFVVKARDYNVTAVAPTSQQTSQTNFSVIVNVTALGGSDNATGEINVYYFNETTPNPTTTAAAGSCTAIGTGVVGSYTVTCSIPHAGAVPGDHYLRARVIVPESGTTLEWWSAETTVRIGTVGIPTLPFP